MNHLVSDTISLLDSSTHHENTLMQVETDSLQHPRGTDYLPIAAEAMEEAPVVAQSTVVQTVEEANAITSGLQTQAGSTVVFLDLAGADGDMQKVYLTSEDGESVWEINIDKLNNDLQQNEGGIVVLPESTLAHTAGAQMAVEISTDGVLGRLANGDLVTTNQIVESGSVLTAVTAPQQEMTSGVQIQQVLPIVLDNKQQTFILQPNQTAVTSAAVSLPSVVHSIGNVEMPPIKVLPTNYETFTTTGEELVLDSSRRIQNVVDSLLVKVVPKAGPLNEARSQLYAKDVVMKPDSAPKPPFRCSKCSFEERQSLRKFRRHLKSHEAEKKHKCSECLASFNQEINLTIHKAGEHDFQRTEVEAGRGSTRLVCPVCRKEFSRSASYKGHLQGHCIDDDVNCTICGESYPDRDSLAAHLEKHSQMPPPSVQSVRCSQCGINLPSLGHIRRHYNEEHPRMLRRKGLPKKADIPVQVDPEPPCCEEKEEAGDRPSRQSKAKASTILSKVTKGQLLVVGDVKTEEAVTIEVKKRRSMKGSNSVISTNGMLPSSGSGENRALLAETLANTPSLKCIYCNKQFNKRSLLKRHLIVHTKERPYVCTICGRGFSQRSSLRTHEPTHKQSRPFKCPQCPEAFTQKGNLKVHINRVHGGSQNQTANVDAATNSVDESQGVKIGLKGDPSTTIKAYQCPHCNLVSDVEKNVILHIAEVHSFSESSGKELNNQLELEPMSFVKQLEECMTENRPQNNANNSLVPGLTLHNAAVASGLDHLIVPVDLDEDPPLKTKATTIPFHTEFFPQQPPQPAQTEIKKDSIQHAPPQAFSSMLSTSNNTVVFVTQAPNGTAPVSGDLKVEHTGHGGSFYMQAAPSGEFGGPDPKSKTAPAVNTDYQVNEDVHEVVDRVTGRRVPHFIKRSADNNRRLLVCRVCRREFKKAVDLVRHSRLHTNDRPFPCPQCRKLFRLKSVLQNHLRTHRGTKDFHCSFCEKSFTMSQSLRVHMRLHTGNHPYACHLCHLHFPSASHRKYHVRTHPDRDFRQLTRSMVSVERQNASRAGTAALEPLKLDPAAGRLVVAGRRGGAEGDVNRPHHCPYCPAAYKMENHMRAHIRRRHMSDSQQACCRYCGKFFTSNYALRQHVEARHYNMKPHQCRICGACFSTKSSLSRHMTCHSPSRPYICPYCRKSFKTLDVVRKHIRNHVRDGEDQPAAMPDNNLDQVLHSLMDTDATAGPSVIVSSSATGAVSAAPQVTSVPVQVGTSQVQPSAGPTVVKTFALTSGTQTDERAATNRNQGEYLTSQPTYIIQQPQPQPQHQTHQQEPQTQLAPATHHHHQQQQQHQQHLHQQQQPQQPPPPPPPPQQQQQQQQQQPQSQHQQHQQPQQQPQPQQHTILHSAVVEDGQCIFPVDGGQTYAYVTDEQGVTLGPESLLNVLEAQIICDAPQVPVSGIAVSSANYEHHQLQTVLQPSTIYTQTPIATIEEHKPKTDEYQAGKEQEVKEFVVPGPQSIIRQIQPEEYYQHCVNFDPGTTLILNTEVTGQGLVAHEGSTFALLPEDLAAGEMIIDGTLTLPSVEKRTDLEPPSTSASAAAVTAGAAAEPMAQEASASTDKAAAEAVLVEPEYYGCNQCSVSYSSPVPLTAHMRQEHQLLKSHRCDICFKFLSSRLALTVHHQGHLTNDGGLLAPRTTFKCPACEATFTTQASLTRHVVSSHEQEQPYACRHCTAKFRTIRDLKTHVIEVLEARQTLTVDANTARRKASQRALYARSVMHRLRLDDAQTSQIADLEPNAQMTVSEKYLIEVAQEKNQKISMPGDHRRGRRIDVARMKVEPDTKPPASNSGRHYGCKVCHNSFRKPSDLRRHMYTHTGERPYQCDQCVRSFTAKESLKAHQKVHSSECRLYICHVCGVTCSTKASLKVHMRLHTGSKPYGCLECPQRFRTPSQRIKHFLVVHQKSYPASRKKRSLLPGRGAAAAAAVKPAAAETATVVVESVSAVVTEPAAAVAAPAPSGGTSLLVEALVEGKSVEVSSSAATAQFSKLAASESTSRSDTECAFITRGWRCTQCGHDFLDNAMYQSHACISNAATPSHASPDSEISPIVVVNVAPAVAAPAAKENACEVCGKVFSRPALLERHSRIHTGERPFRCRQCPASFNQEVALRVHLAKHNSERLYRCPVCHAGFSQRGNMQQHLARMHPDQLPSAADSGTSSSA